LSTEARQQCKLCAAGTSVAFHVARVEDGVGSSEDVARSEAIPAQRSFVLYRLQQGL
jgi:hypothetical protein